MVCSRPTIVEGYSQCGIAVSDRTKDLTWQDEANPGRYIELRSISSPIDCRETREATLLFMEKSSTASASGSGKLHKLGITKTTKGGSSLESQYDSRVAGKLRDDKAFPWSLNGICKEHQKLIYIQFGRLLANYATGVSRNLVK